MRSSASILWCLVHGLMALAVDEQIPAAVLHAVPLERLAEHVTRCPLDAVARQPARGRRPGAATGHLYFLR